MVLALYEALLKVKDSQKNIIIICQCWQIISVLEHLEELANNNFKDRFGRRICRNARWPYIAQKLKGKEYKVRK